MCVVILCARLKLLDENRNQLEMRSAQRVLPANLKCESPAQKSPASPSGIAQRRGCRMETPRNRKLRRPQLGESDRPVSTPPSEKDITVPDKIAGSAALRLRERVSIKIIISSRAVPIFQNLVCTVIALSRLLPVDYVHRVPQQPSHRTHSCASQCRRLL